MASFNQRKQMTKNLLNSPNLRYENRHGIEHQINQLLHQINSLTPSVDNYVYNNGVQARLFQLHGTIPIMYKGSTYNIPVAFWFPLNFPKNPPICYVKPVSGMKIKAKHKHVDSQGLIYHPYLHGWSQNGNPSLVDLIGILCSAFGKEPPLYSQRPSQQIKAQAQAQAHPQSHPQSQSQYGQYQQHPPVSSQPYSHSHSQYQPPPPSSQPPISQINNNNNNQQNGSINNPNDNNNNNNDIRSKVEDKLRVELQELYDHENEVLNTLADKRKQLESRRTNIDKIKNELENENALLVSRKSDLEKKIESLEGWLKENEDSNEMDVSKVVLPSDTWSDQCMDAVAGDVALTDVMLELDKALEDETVTLDQYMKQIRKCAREQFMKRALARTVYDKQNEVVTRNNPSLAAAQQQRRGRPYFAASN